MTVAGLMRYWYADEIRALSLRQPHASLVALGEKHIETRSFQRKYVGPIAIASSASWKTASKRRAFEHPEFTRAWRRHRHIVQDIDDLPLGVIVAVARIVSYLPSEFIVAMDRERRRRTRLALEGVICGESEIAFGDFSRNRFGWVLADVHRLTVPVPCKGALGIWRIAPATRARLNRATVVRVD
jgi:activating signal cointegrator 1